MGRGGEGERRGEGRGGEGLSRAGQGRKDLKLSVF